MIFVNLFVARLIDVFIRLLQYSTERVVVNRGVDLFLTRDSDQLIFYNWSLSLVKLIGRCP